MNDLQEPVVFSRDRPLRVRTAAGLFLLLAALPAIPVCPWWAVASAIAGAGLLFAGSGEGLRPAMQSSGAANVPKGDAALRASADGGNEPAVRSDPPPLSSFSELIRQRAQKDADAAAPDAPPQFDAPKARIEGVNFYYGETQALFDVTMSIPARAVTALIGPSGCGKSTFLRTLNRMNDIIEGAWMRGTVLIDGQDIYAPGVDVVELRKRVGMVFQKSTPFPKSVFENVAFGPRIAGVRNRRQLTEIVESSLKRAALWEEVKDRLGDSAMALSGGQQQRLCIARALATNPDVILMDEPASALDPASTSRIEDLIFELKENYTIVIVTHNMQQAARISDWTAFFYRGRLIEFDNTEQLFTKPKKKQTEDYITGRFG